MFRNSTGSRPRQLGVASVAGVPAFAQSNGEWDKMFPKSEKVDHQKVSFKPRYGITTAGDPYLPKDRGHRRLPALAVGGLLVL